MGSTIQAGSVTAAGGGTRCRRRDPSLKTGPWEGPVTPRGRLRRAEPAFAPRTWGGTPRGREALGRELETCYWDLLLRRRNAKTAAVRSVVVDFGSGDVGGRRCRGEEEGC